MPQYSYLQTAPAFIMAFVLFITLNLVYVLGHRFRAYHLRRNPLLKESDLTTINGMLLGLLGLMLAFSFSMANERFDSRRALVVEEANIISTVIQRTDMYSDSLRTAWRSVLRQYVEERIAFYEARMDVAQAAVHFLRADSISNRLWSQVVGQAKKDQETTRTSQIIPALNDMMDITTTRRAAGEGTIPPSIMYFLFVLCVVAAFLLGYDSKGPLNGVMVVGFALMLSATVFTIIDLDRPRSGIINLDGPHQRMVDLRSMF